MQKFINPSKITDDILNNDVFNDNNDDESTANYDPEYIATKILHYAKITQLPVNLYQIADSIKMEVSERADFINTMGAVNYSENHIILNPNYDNPRFAFALILGDIIRQSVVPDYPDFVQDPDKWLTHIALAILMPKQQFMEKYNSGEPYENIAADFDVTDEDFGHRLDTLNL